MANGLPELQFMDLSQIDARATQARAAEQNMRLHQMQMAEAQRQMDQEAQLAQMFKSGQVDTSDPLKMFGQVAGVSPRMAGPMGSNLAHMMQYKEAGIARQQAAAKQQFDMDEKERVQAVHTLGGLLYNMPDDQAASIYSQLHAKISASNPRIAKQFPPTWNRPILQTMFDSLRSADSLAKGDESKALIPTDLEWEDAEGRRIPLLRQGPNLVRADQVNIQGSSQPSRPAPVSPQAPQQAPESTMRIPDPTGERKATLQAGVDEMDRRIAATPSVPGPAGPASGVAPGAATTPGIRRVKVEKPDTSSEINSRFENIRTKQNLGKPVSDEDAAWADAYAERVQLAGVGRAEAWGDIRQEKVIDTKNGNAPVLVSANELNRAKKEEPGRYLSQSEGIKALRQTALLEDIRGAITKTRTSLGNVDLNFPATVRAELAYITKQSEPTSAWQSFWRSKVMEDLTPQQIDYLTDIAQLHENAMAMRNLLGAGQSSEDLREAVRATIPLMLTPGNLALAQLDKFEQQLDRLARGVPTVPLKNLPGEAKQPSSTTTTQQEGRATPTPTQKIKPWKDENGELVGWNTISQKPVKYSVFFNAMRSAQDGISEPQIWEAWKAKYGGE
jgi:hypothetical protein